MDKFQKLFHQLSNKEQADFLSFCQSPYFNKNEKITGFIQHYIEAQLHLIEEKIPIEKLPEFLFDGKRSKQLQLATIKHQALRLLVQFLGQEEMKKEELQLNFFTFKGTYRKNHQLGTAVLEKLSNKLENLSPHSAEGSLINYQINHELAYCTGLHDGTFTSFISRSHHHLEQFNLKAQLALRIGLLDTNSVVNLDDIVEMEDAESMISRFERFNTPDLLGQIHYYQYLSIKYPGNKQYFQKLLDLLFQEDTTHFQAEEIHHIFRTNINLCIRGMRVDFNYYAPLCLELYERGIQTKVLLQEGYLTEWMYRNVIKLALQLGRISWTEQFIYQYKKHITSEARSNAFHLSLAELSFIKEDYDLTLEYLGKINNNNFRYYLSAKTILVKTFYETGNMDSCMSTVGAMTVYISRLKHISKPIKKGYLHFCQILHQITTARTQKKIEKVKEKLQITTPLAERNWLQDVFRREHPKA